MSIHPHEVDAWHIAEADVEELKRRLQALGEPIPDKTISSANPRMDAQYYAWQLRNEIRALLLRRHGEALRSDLESIASTALLDQLDAAQVPDSYRIDDVVPLRLARRVRELLA